VIAVSKSTETCLATKQKILIPAEAKKTQQEYNSDHKLHHEWQ
jgi:hypothetical protein